MQRRERSTEGGERNHRNNHTQTSPPQEPHPNTTTARIPPNHHHRNNHSPTTKFSTTSKNKKENRSGGREREEPGRREKVDRGVVLRKWVLWGWVYGLYWWGKDGFGVERDGFMGLERERKRGKRDLGVRVAMEDGGKRNEENLDLITCGRIYGFIYKMLTCYFLIGVCKIGFYTSFLLNLISLFLYILVKLYFNPQNIMVIFFFFFEKHSILLFMSCTLLN